MFDKELTWPQIIGIGCLVFILVGLISGVAFSIFVAPTLVPLALTATANPTPRSALDVLEFVASLPL